MFKGDMQRFFTELTKK